MDTNTWLAIGGFIFTLLLTIISVSVSYAKQQKEVENLKQTLSEISERVNSDIAESEEQQKLKLQNVQILLEGETKTLKGTIENQKSDIKKLEDRVTDHKDKIFMKIERLETTIERRDNTLSCKIDELKNLIIDKLGNK